MQLMGVREFFIYEYYEIVRVVSTRHPHARIG